MSFLSADSGSAGDCRLGETRRTLVSGGEMTGSFVVTRGVESGEPDAGGNGEVPDR